VSAGTAQGQRRIVLPLDLVETIEQALHRVCLDLVVLEVGLRVRFGVLAKQPQIDVHVSIFAQPARNVPW
jgi:hypothetical protein